MIGKYKDKSKFVTCFSPIERVIATLLGGILVHFAFKMPWLESYITALIGVGLFAFLDATYHIVYRAVYLIKQYRQARKMYAKLTKAFPVSPAVDNIVESEDKYEV